MAALLNLLSSARDYEVDDDASAQHDKQMTAQEIISTLTSLCSTNNCNIAYGDKILYGLEGAEIRKEKSFDKHFTGDIGRVYLIGQEQRGEHGYNVGWVLNDASGDCMVCESPFDMISSRRHHCRACGCLVCDDCSRGRGAIAQLSASKKVTWRVCDVCVARNPPDEVWDVSVKRQTE